MPRKISRVDRMMFEESRRFLGGTFVNEHRQRKQPIRYPELEPNLHPKKTL